jgi:hypothetical protein
MPSVPSIDISIWSTQSVGTQMEIPSAPGFALFKSVSDARSLLNYHVTVTAMFTWTIAQYLSVS